VIEGLTGEFDAERCPWKQEPDYLTPAIVGLAVERHPARDQVEDVVAGIALSIDVLARSIDTNRRMGGTQGLAADFVFDARAKALWRELQ
jgi:hypothetical protein